MPPVDADPKSDPDHRDWYLREFISEIDRQIPRLSNFRRQEAEDLRSSMCLWLIERPHLMATYHPRALAATSIRQRAVDFYRSMARQFPQGRFDSAVGGLSKPLLWLDAPKSSGTSDSGDDHGIPTATTSWTTPNVEDRVVNSMMFGARMKNLSPRQRQVFVLVELDGQTVVQAARTMGVRREWAQRALGQARRTVRSSPSRDRHGTEIDRYDSID